MLYCLLLFNILANKCQWLKPYHKVLTKLKWCFSWSSLINIKVESLLFKKMNSRFDFVWSQVSRIGAMFHLLNPFIEELLGVCAQILCCVVVLFVGRVRALSLWHLNTAVSPALTLIETDGESEAQPQGTSSESAHTHTHTALNIYCICLLRQASQLLLLILDP